jgi:hypothetical protein
MGDDGGIRRREWARRPRSRGQAEMRADVLDDGRIRNGSDQVQPGAAAGTCQHVQPEGGLAPSRVRGEHAMVEKQMRLEAQGQPRQLLQQFERLYVQRQLRHTSIELTVDSYGKWQPIEPTRGGVDALDEPKW